MKVFNLIFGLLFIISAGLQFNDPDPVLWIFIYLTAAILLLRAYQEIYYPIFSLLFCSSLIIYSLYLFFDDNGVLTWFIDHNGENIAGSMKASAPWIEETREFFGLVIIIICVLSNYFNRRNKIN